MGPKPHLVLYHANCPDGFAAACVVAWFVGDDDCEFRPVQYGDARPTDDDLTSRRCVWIVDFSYSAEDMKHILRTAPALTWTDHHDDELRHEVDSLLEDLADDYATVARLFDVAECGATATWRLCIGAGTIHERPTILGYVRDRDLWKWELPDSKAVSAYFDALRGTDEPSARFLFDVKPEHVEIGLMLLRAQEKRVALAVKSARFDAIPMRVVPTPSEPEYIDCKIAFVNTATDISEVGDALCQAGADLACMYWWKKDGTWGHSLRSRKNERFPDAVDCREIAAEYGGGGHRQAAGFTASKPWLGAAGQSAPLSEPTTQQPVTSADLDGDFNRLNELLSDTRDAHIENLKRSNDTLRRMIAALVREV